MACDTRVHAASREDIDVDRLICLKARKLNASLIAFAAAGSLEAAKAQFVTNKSLTHLLLAEMTWALFTENQLLRLRPKRERDERNVSAGFYFALLATGINAPFF